MNTTTDTIRDFLSATDRDGNEEVRKGRLEATKAVLAHLGASRFIGLSIEDRKLFVDILNISGPVPVEEQTEAERMIQRIHARYGHDLDIIRTYYVMAETNASNQEIAKAIQFDEKLIEAHGTVVRIRAAHQQLMYEDAHEDGKLWTVHAFMMKNAVRAFVYPGFSDDTKLRELEDLCPDSFGHATALFVGDEKAARERAAGLLNSRNITIEFAE